MRGPDTDDGADPYRGLVIAPDEVGRLLQRGPGEPWLFADELIGADPATARGRDLLARTLSQSQTHVSPGWRFP